MQSRTRGSALLLGIVVGLTGLSGAVLANEPWGDGSSPKRTPSTGPVEAQPPRTVRIDQLLKLPTSYRTDDVRKGDLTKLEWRARFDEARSNLEESEKTLARVRSEIKQVAGNASQWNVAPPGAEVNNADNPTSFRLTQELRRGREDVIEAEKRLTALDIEANLASVKRIGKAKRQLQALDSELEAIQTGHSRDGRLRGRAA